MRRFEYDEGDDFFKDDLENFFDYDSDSNEFAIQKGEIINVLQLDLIEIDLNIKLLVIVIKMLEKSFLWRFRRFSKKIEIIKDAYLKLTDIVNTNREKEGKDDDADL